MPLVQPFSWPICLDVLCQGRVAGAELSGELSDLPIRPFLGWFSCRFSDLRIVFTCFHMFYHGVIHIVPCPIFLVNDMKIHESHAAKESVLPLVLKNTLVFC